jgi:hypothetical protein
MTSTLLQQVIRYNKCVFDPRVGMGGQQVGKHKNKKELIIERVA